MEEAKSLVHMCITALFGVLILAAVLALITLANFVWRAFSRQNDANRQMREYSEYSAFDGTTVRGQDVIALMHSTQGQPYILIVDSSGNPIMLAYDSVTKGLDVQDAALSQSTPSDVRSLLISASKSGMHDSIEKIANSMGSEGNYDYTIVANVPPYSEIQEFFLNRGLIVTGDTAGYLQYESHVLYDGSDTTDITGILLKEAGMAEGGE